MLLPALLVTTFLCIARAERNYTADVQAFVAKFHELNETLDVLDSLERIGEHSNELFRIGYPLVEFMKQGVNMTDEDSEETIAMMELRKIFSMDEFYRSRDSTYSDAIYMHTATLKMHYMSMIMQIVGSPTMVASMKSYWSYLGADLDSVGILSSIDGMTRLRCPMPEKEGIKRMARIQESLREIDNRVKGGQEEDIEWDSFKRSHITPLIAHATEEDIDTLLTNITEIESPTHEMVLEVFRHWSRSTHVYTDIYTSCLMETTNAGCEFNQTEFLSRISRWHRDILRSVLFKWVVSSITEPNEKSYYQDAVITTLLLERTGHFIAEWTRTYQNISWPEMGIEAAKDAIGFEEIPIESFNETARKVQKIFEESGSQSYSYQVLVVSTSEADISWSVGTTMTDDYTNIINFNGVDIHIFRYNRTESLGRSLVVKKFNTKREDILKELRIVSSTNATLSTKNYLSYFQEESSSGPFYGKDFYRSVILLQNNGPSDSKEATIPVGLATFENASFKLETSRTSYSVLKPGKETVHSFKAFFFL